MRPGVSAESAARVLATTYVRAGESLIVLASWSDRDETVKLAIDRSALGIAGPLHVFAPAVAGLQSAAEIDPAWVEDASCIGVTAGASAPEVLVTAVVARLEELAGGRAEVNALPAVDEGVTFQLPAQLR